MQKFVLSGLKFRVVLFPPAHVPQAMLESPRYSLDVLQINTIYTRILAHMKLSVAKSISAIAVCDQSSFAGFHRPLHFHNNNSIIISGWKFGVMLSNMRRDDSSIFVNIIRSKCHALVKRSCSCVIQCQ